MPTPIDPPGDVSTVSRAGPCTEDRDGPGAESAGRLKILLADDSAVARIFAARLLEFSGHDVDIVTDGRQAVNAARNAAYDMILMDVHMPEMDGIQATVALRAGGCTLPIVALSGTAVEEDFASCLDAGMNGTLPKPFTLDAFERECVRMRGPGDGCGVSDNPRL